jgi:RNA polymerase sigma factor (sigma-70 family)
MDEAGRGVDHDPRSEALARFQVAYDAAYGPVSAYIRRRTADQGDAQDALAETFTIAWRRLDELPEPETALPWLYGVARRVLANQRRGNRRRDDLASRLRGQRGGGVDVEAEVAASEDRRIVLAAMSRLRNADQEVLRLAVWEELPHRDIAAIVGCAEPAVAVRLHRARSRLAREIGKEERHVGQKGAGRPGRTESNEQ